MGDSSLKVIIQAKLSEGVLILKILIIKILKGEMPKKEDQMKRESAFALGPPRALFPNT